MGRLTLDACLASSTAFAGVNRRGITRGAALRSSRLLGLLVPWCLMGCPARIAVDKTKSRLSGRIDRGGGDQGSVSP